MSKVTPRDLTECVAIINAARGAPVETLSLSIEAGRYVHNVGNWSWNKSTHGWELVEVVNDRGAMRTMLSARKKGELYALLGAMLTGISIGQGAAGSPHKTKRKLS